MIGSIIEYITSALFDPDLEQLPQLDRYRIPEIATLIKHHGHPKSTSRNLPVLALGKITMS
jgi:hypothetical protein